MVRARHVVLVVGEKFFPRHYGVLSVALGVDLGQCHPTLVAVCVRMIGEPYRAVFCVVVRSHCLYPFSVVIRSRLGEA